MKWISFALATLFSVSFINQAQSAPQISDVNGEISHGQTVTIQGSSFGSKSQPSPMIFDTVEAGDFDSNWATHYDLLPNQSDQRHGNSQYNGHLNFRGGHRQGKFEAPGEVHPKWFVQYWFKISDNWDWGNTGYDGNNRFLSNIKIFRMWSPSNINENFVLAMAGWSNDIEYTVENVASDNGGYLMSGYKELMTKDQWHLFQFEYLENSAPGQANGQFRAWFDGELVREDNGLLTREDFSNLKRPFIIGWSAVWAANGSQGESDDAPNDFYIDDVYMDNTWARVEIGNNQNYADCTHREIQTPLTWSSNSVEIRVNSGSFQEDDTAYLFVTDQNGIRNQTGIEITIGESGGVVDPPNPNPDPELIWDATDQAGNSNWFDSSVTYSVRLLIQPEFIQQSGQQIQLAFQGRTNGNYSIKKVSIAERDLSAPEGDVVDATWTQVPFDGQPLSSWDTMDITVNQGETKKSDLFDFPIDETKEYYVTFKINTPSVYLDVPSTYRELYFFDEDHSSDIDWSNNGHDVTRDYHALSGIFVSPQNQKPVANAGPDQVLTDTDGNGFEVVTVDASQSFDPDGTIDLYLIRYHQTGEFAFQESPVFSGSFPVGVHIFDVKVRDNLGLMSDIDQIQITIEGQSSPAADAGADQVVINRIGDGFVDGADFSIWQRHFGAREGDPNWNPCADMNNSGRVDAADYVVWRDNFGSVNGGVADINGCLDESITLDASRSTDPDNDIVRYRWVDTCHGVVELLYDGEDDVAEDILIKGIGIHNIVLTVFDSNGNSSDDALIVELREDTQSVTNPEPPALILPDPDETAQPVVGGTGVGVTRFSAARGETGTMNLSLKEPSLVSIKVVNQKGRIIRHLVSSAYGKGNYEIPWDGLDDFGRRVASGAYNILCYVGETLHKLKMVVLN